jgi:hypothetical protein
MRILRSGENRRRAIGAHRPPRESMPQHRVFPCKYSPSGASGLVNGAEQCAVQRVTGLFRGKEAKATLVQNDDASGNFVDLNDVG